MNKTFTSNMNLTIIFANNTAARGGRKRSWWREESWSRRREGSWCWRRGEEAEERRPLRETATEA